MKPLKTAWFAMIFLSRQMKVPAPQLLSQITGYDVIFEKMRSTRGKSSCARHYYEPYLVRQTIYWLDPK